MADRCFTAPFTKAKIRKSRRVLSCSVENIYIRNRAEPFFRPLNIPAKSMLIIGIAGGTGSGKTTVVRKIVESLPDGSVAVIPQDSYYHDQSELPLEVRKRPNFDHPDAFEWPLLSHQIEELKAGRAIEQPT